MIIIKSMIILLMNVILLSYSYIFYPISLTQSDKKSHPKKTAMLDEYDDRTSVSAHVFFFMINCIMLPINSI